MKNNILRIIIFVLIISFISIGIWGIVTGNIPITPEMVGSTPSTINKSEDIKPQYVDFTVKDKERVNYGQNSKYLIFTENETFENTDELIRGKFNSSDLYGFLDVGKTYKCEVMWWRIPILSMYRNLISCETKE